MTGAEGSGKSCAVANGGRMLPPILLVEDEIFIRIATAEWLRAAGYAVAEAANAGEALELLASGQDLAMLATDISMPGVLDGLALAARLRASRPGLPILLLSAQVPPDFADRADGALGKPFGPGELVAAVTALIGPPGEVADRDSAGLTG